jgi:hypothetical protein
LQRIPRLELAQNLPSQFRANRITCPPASPTVG